MALEEKPCLAFEICLSSMPRSFLKANCNKLTSLLLSCGFYLYALLLIDDYLC